MRPCDACIHLPGAQVYNLDSRHPTKAGNQYASSLPACLSPCRESRPLGLARQRHQQPIHRCDRAFVDRTRSWGWRSLHHASLGSFGLPCTTPEEIRSFGQDNCELPTVQPPLPEATGCRLVVSCISQLNPRRPRLPPSRSVMLIARRRTSSLGINPWN